jgi:hypothetical protein
MKPLPQPSRPPPTKPSKLSRLADELASAIDQVCIEIGDDVARLFRRLAALFESPPPHDHAAGRG